MEYSYEWNYHACSTVAVLLGWMGREVGIGASRCDRMTTASFIRLINNSLLTHLINAIPNATVCTEPMIIIIDFNDWTN